VTAPLPPICSPCQEERSRWLDTRPSQMLPRFGIAHGSGAAYDVSAAGIGDNRGSQYEQWRQLVRSQRDLIARTCREQRHATARPHHRFARTGGVVILDLYAGAGGWDQAARQLGLDTVGLEIWHDACVTAVRAGHPRIQCDIATYPTAPFTGRVTGLIASPPCQAWSAAGKRLGEQDKVRVHALVDQYAAGNYEPGDGWADPRSHHAAEPVRWIRDLRPEWVCLEQVPEVLPLWSHIDEVLRGWGYSVWAGKLCAADYGVPQTRNRAVLIASRVRRVNQPTPTHYDPSHGMSLFGTPWVTMAEAVGWAGEFVLQSRRDSPNWVRQHGTRENRTASSPAPTITGEVFRWKVRAGQNSQMGDGSQKRYERSTDRPAPTVIGTVSRWKLIAGEYTRPVDLTEAAVLQGFRPDYPWHGHKTSQAQQIGNAVPPGLGAAVIAESAGLQAAQMAVAA